MHRLPAQRQRDPERLACLQRQPEASRLVVRTLDHVDHADPDGHRARRVDAGEDLDGHVLGGAVAETEPADSQGGTLREQEHEGLQGGLGRRNAT